MADILRRYGQHQFSRLCPVQRESFVAIINCRTAPMGGHLEQCDHCGYKMPVYNSCRNRHCPKCQYIKQEQWVDQLKSSLPPTRYFHLVFTIPHTLNKLFYINQSVCYDLLFKAAWLALKQAANNPSFLGADTGCVALLHTWGQSLTYHPHIHMIVPAGGISSDGMEWIRASRKFFLPVKVLGKMFRGILCRMIAERIDMGHIRFPDDVDSFPLIRQQLYTRNWIVDCRRAFGGRAGVIQYLGRYTHRVAINNSRIISMGNGKIRFRWKDYSNVHSGNKVMELKASEFIRRFFQHILPKAFYKIRYYGILASAHAKSKRVLLFDLLDKVPSTGRLKGLTAIQALEIITGKNPLICPKCKQGLMTVINSIQPKLITPV